MKKKRRSSEKTSTVAPKSHTWRPYLVILLAGLLLRTIYDFHLAGSILWGNYQLDSLVYHSWAMAILDGSSIDSAFFRAPLYPYTVALLYKLFGVSPWPVVIFQNLLGIATAFTSYRFALKLIGRRLAFWVGLAVACYPTLIFFEGETLMTTVTVFLYTLSIFHLHKAIQTPSGRNALVTGLIFGLAAITRPAILPLLIVFPVVAAMKLGLSHWRSILVSTLVMIGGTMIPIAPVTIANDAASGELVLISTQAGANFYIGNSQEADGITVTALGPQMRIGKYRDNIRTSAKDEAERRVGRALSQSEVSSFWFHEAFKEIANEPARALRLFVRKLYYFWHGQEIINNRSLYYAGEYSWLMKLMLFKHGLNFPAGLLFPLMLVGVYYALRNRKEVAVPLWCMLGLALIMAAFFVCARFRQPVLPVAIIFAVLGVAELVSGLKRPDGQRAGRVAILIFILSALGLNLGGNIDSLANRSTFQAYLGSSFLRKANATQAIVHLEEARRIDAENMLVYEVLGKAYLRANEIDKAERVYLAGLERFRVYPHYNFNLGRIAQTRGRPDEAKQYYLTTITCAPEYAAAYEGLGAIYEQSQRYDSALYYYEQLYKLTPKPSLKSKIESVSKALNSTLPTH
jgi:4-amino-4-deoxy-L-arabinose transferase-like glycosyltransferase